MRCDVCQSKRYISCSLALLGNRCWSNHSVCNYFRKSFTCLFLNLSKFVFHVSSVFHEIFQMFERHVFVDKEVEDDLNTKTKSSPAKNGKSSLKHRKTEAKTPEKKVENWTVDHHLVPWQSKYNGISLIIGRTFRNEFLSNFIFVCSVENHAKLCLILVAIKLCQIQLEL